MPKKEPGYVYILTNPSFKEDWVKIGKSGRTVNVRSKELDNTAVPLPFDIYATLKTVKYEDAEKTVHDFIDLLTTKRIRKTREFFNLKPEEALQIFKKVAQLLDDAEISIYKDNVIVETIVAKQNQEGNDDYENIHHIDLRSESVSKKSWLIPFNKKYFDLDGCLQKYGRVFWSQRANFLKGDMVYLYSSLPDARITYSFEVERANIPNSNETEEGSEFRKYQDQDTLKETDYSVLLKPVGKSNSKHLTLFELKKHGLKAAPLGPMMLSQQKFRELLSHIVMNFDEVTKIEKSKSKRPNFKFSMCDININETVTFLPLNLEVKVVADDKVEYKGEQLKLSTFVKKYIPDNMRTSSNSYQGALFFTYKDEILEDIRTRNEAKIKEQ